MKVGDLSAAVQVAEVVPTVHSEQGSQYTATRFRERLANHGAAQNRSRRGNCYDNVQAESLWNQLKTKLLDGSSFAVLAESQLKAAHYLAYL